MENLVVYLIKSATLLLLFYLTYYCLLKNNTFFTTNRWFLLFGLFCAAFLPLLSFQKIVWVEPVISSTDKSNFKVIAVNVMDNLPLPAEESFLISWEMVVGLLYGIGVLVFLTQLLVEFYSLRKIIKSKSKIKVDGFELIEVEEAISPFSFFKKIVYNRNLFQPEELHNIIEHEKIHAKQLHSLDVLIGRIFCILFWWNPVIWFYKKAIIQNLEFIADHDALAKAKDKKSYLLTLLKITTAETHVAITNHFYQSLIKKRIVMLNKNQSKKHHSWSYFVVLPALVFFMLTYQVEVVAQEREVERTAEDTVYSRIEFTIVATSEVKSIFKEAAFFSKVNGLTVNVKNISRNEKGEINAIKVELYHKKLGIKIYDVLSDNPIKPFNIFAEKNHNSVIGFGFKEQINNSVAESITITDNEMSEELKIISTSTTYSIHINADYSDKSLNNFKNFLKKDFNLNLKFISVSRNSESKITGIDITVSNEKDISKSFVIIEGEPIKPFDIFVKTDDKKEQIFGFSASQDNAHMKLHLEAVERSKNISKSKQFVLSMEEKNGKYVMKSAPKSDVFMEEFSLEDNGAFLKNTLILLDRKIIFTEEFDKIDPNSIKSVTLVKRARNNIVKYEELFEKYGERAENGIIEIKTNDLQEPAEKEGTLENDVTKVLENTTFVISKLSQKDDFDWYEKFLEKTGIKLKISGVKRNAEGFIMSIKFKLMDEFLKTNMDEWQTFSNPNGIPDILIGRKKGKLVLNAE